MPFKHLIIGTTAVLLLASPALAHSPIKDANITAGAVYEAAPESFDFSFSKAVGLAKITLKTTAGGNLALDYEKPKSMRKDFSVPLPILSQGDYLLMWSAVASDGHVMKGDITFSIGENKSEVKVPTEEHKGH